jgi:hypothetical protein
MGVLLWYNKTVGQLGDIVASLKSEYDPIVISRESGRCFICQSTGNHVHEVLSKSKFSVRDIHICIQPKNMVLLCMRHHSLVQGRPRFMGHLLRAMALRYGYVYDAPPFDWYFNNEYLAPEETDLL